MSIEKPKIMISGYYGFGNAGDEAILSAIVSMLKKELKEVEIIVLSENPKETSREYKVSSLHRKDWETIFYKLPELDLFVSGGGGLVQDVTGVTTILYYLGLVLMAKLRGIKVMSFANGIGPVTTLSGKLLAKWILNTVDLITLRDENSKKLLDEMGVSKPPVYVTADPVFDLQPSRSQEFLVAVDDYGINVSRFKLGISVRPWNTPTDYLRSIAKIADEYAETKNAKVLIFPFQHSQDMKTCHELRSFMKQPATLIDKPFPIPILMGLIGRMDMLIGMRLHSLIFGVCQGVPSVGVSYDPKVTSLMKMVDMPVVNIQSINEDELRHNCTKVYNSLARHQKELPMRVQPLKDKARENVNLLEKLLLNTL